MGIYKRGKIWCIDYYDQNHIRVQESSHSSRRADADSLLVMRKSEVLRGVYKRPVKMTFGEFGKRYMEHAKANKRSWLRDQQMLGHLERFFGSERQLGDISAADIEGYKLRRREAVSGSTVNRELALLKRMFNLAIAWDLFLGSNPVRKIKFFREFNIGIRVLSPVEEVALLKHATPYIQDIVRFALGTGLRIGDILSLPWSEVDLETDILKVFAAKPGKITEIPINSEVRKVLEYWRLGKRNEHVFYNLETGKPFVDLKAGFALACKKAGIVDVTWHTLRHTFASRLLDRGVDIVAVKELLGHSTLMVTMRYAHTNLTNKRAGVEKLVGFGDKLVTVGPQVQQLKPKLSQMHA